MIHRITIKQLHSRLKAQGVAKEHMAFVCPNCGLVQSAFDFIMTKRAGNTFEEVGKFLGFSCVHRFRPAGAGCDFSLGGLLAIHTLEVITGDGIAHPRFRPAFPAEAKEHMKRNLS